MPDATKQALWAVTDALKNDDEAPLVYLAMAALQLKHGALEEWLKVIALSHVLQGTGLDQWDGAIAERKQAELAAADSRPGTTVKEGDD